MSLFDTTLQNDIEQAGIIAVLVIEKIEQVRPLMKALSEGGIRAIELTLRTDCALEALQIVSKEFPDIIVGAGTVLTPQQLTDVQATGAAFAAAPGMNPSMLQAAAAAKFSFAPGVATPSEIEAALMHDCKLLKLFPAESMGGLSYLNTINGPYKHLGLKYVPLGGLNIDNMQTYLQSPIVAALGGSWIAPAPLIAKGDWESIYNNALAATKLTK